MTKTCFMTTNGPKAVGPYSTAVKVDGTAYLSGIVPIVPATGKIVEGGIEAQTQQVLDNISVVLSELSLTCADVVKTTVFLTDLGDFATVNGIYSRYFTENCPARSCVQVAKLPLNVSIEIEVIATYK